MERRFLRDEEIVEADVFDEEGALLGQIRDLVIDRYTGNIRYVIVDFEDLLGEEHLNSLHPLPWPMLTYDPAYEQYTVNVSEEQIKNAPEYNAGSFDDRDWERRVHTYYKVWPYWAY